MRQIVKKSKRIIIIFGYFYIIVLFKNQFFKLKWINSSDLSKILAILSNSIKFSKFSKMPKKTNNYSVWFHFGPKQIIIG
jgi:hypothetical protein